MRDAEGYISPRIIIITHTPIEPRLPDKQKAVPRRGGAEAEVTLGVNFGTLLNWLEKKKKKATQYVHANLGKQTELQLAGLPAGRPRGKAPRRKGGRGSGVGRALRLRSPRPRPQAPDTVAARPWWDGVDEEDVVFGEAGVPETECLVNTDVS